MVLSQQILPFLFNLHLPFTLPQGIEVLDVHKLAPVREACNLFYNKFYHDAARRHLLLGINPGRFGGGVTGIPFTDPIRLAAYCGIENAFEKRQELSSVFMYDMMQAYGGPGQFYRKFYISSMSPLGFVRAGKNLNYYDDAELLKLAEPFVVDCINQQLSWGLYTNICFCIGEGENVKYLTRLNEKHGWFDAIKGLPHPRFIMQYKLKQKQEYVNTYITRLACANA
jgi:Domain of unknown function (DUF4918)